MQEPEVLCRIHPVAASALTIMRRKETAPPEFARQLHRLSVLLATEATCAVKTHDVEIQTPMSSYTGKALQGVHALVPIMRAGAGMLDAFRLMLPDAVIWHVSVARDEETLRPIFKDSKVPKSTTGIDTCFVLDPMLATGGSACFTIKHLKERGAGPIVYVGVIGCPQGIERLQDEHPDVRIVLGDIDAILNKRGYIISGLGDAGDRLNPTVPWNVQ